VLQKSFSDFGGMRSHCGSPSVASLLQFPALLNGNGRKMDEQTNGSKSGEGTIF
jgi:hypothetical protein